MRISTIALVLLHSCVGEEDESVVATHDVCVLAVCGVCEGLWVHADAHSELCALLLLLTQMSWRVIDLRTYIYKFVCIYVVVCHVMYRWIYMYQCMYARTSRTSVFACN